MPVTRIKVSNLSAMNMLQMAVYYREVAQKHGLVGEYNSKQVALHSPGTAQYIHYYSRAVESYNRAAANFQVADQWQTDAVNKLMEPDPNVPDFVDNFEDPYPYAAYPY